MKLEELEQLRTLVRRYAAEHAKAPAVRGATRTVETAVTRRIGQELAKRGEA